MLEVCNFWEFHHSGKDPTSYFSRESWRKEVELTWFPHMQALGVLSYIGNMFSCQTSDPALTKETGLFHVTRSSTHSLCSLIHSQLVCLLQVGILNLLSLVDLFGCFKMISVKCQLISTVGAEVRPLTFLQCGLGLILGSTPFVG